MTATLTTSQGGQREHTANAQRHKDGSVLLSVADDRICKLNGVGALTWMILEESPDGLSVDEIASKLSRQFAAINAEGELLYEVSLEQLRQDTARFLRRMSDMKLLQRADANSREIFFIRDGVSGTTSAVRSPTSAVGPNAAAVADNEEMKPSRRETLTAFVALAAFDLLLGIAGFQSLIKRVERWPTSQPLTNDARLCRHVRAMVDRAQMYYPKKAMCLQHSAVVTCLLRRRGVPAEMVLAAQEFPPKGHAWTEVEGEVINDSQHVKTKYLELRRI